MEGVLGFDRDIIAQTLSQYSGRERLESEIASVQELVRLNGESSPPLLRRSWARFLPRTLKSFQWFLRPARCQATITCSQLTVLLNLLLWEFFFFRIFMFRKMWYNKKLIRIKLTSFCLSLVPRTSRFPFPSRLVPGKGRRETLGTRLRKSFVKR